MVCFWAFQLSQSGPLFGRGFWRFSRHVLERFGCRSLARFRAFSLCGSGPLWEFQPSQSGTCLVVLAVAVWSTFGRVSCHGLV